MIILLVFIAIAYRTSKVYTLSPLIMFLAESGLKVFLNPVIFPSLPRVGNWREAWFLSVLSILLVFASYYCVNLNANEKLQFKSLNISKKRARIYLFISVLLFLLLALKGVGLSEWILNSRYAYQYGRNGLGFFYVFSQFFAYLSLYIFLIRSNGKLTSLPLWLLYFSFFGSKRSLVTPLLLAIFVRERAKGKLKFRNIFLVALLVPIMFISSFVFGGGKVSGLVSYFNYFNSSAAVIDKLQNNYFQGEVALSHLWSLVPRSIYPSKPSYHGSGYVTELLYPGMTEKGHFVGSLFWTEWYLDFGLFGVVFGSICLGIFLRYFGNLMEKSIGNTGLLLAFGIVITPILKHVPWWFYFLTLLVLSLRRDENNQRQSNLQ